MHSRDAVAASYLQRREDNAEPMRLMNQITPIHKDAMQTLGRHFWSGNFSAPAVRHIQSYADGIRDILSEINQRYGSDLARAHQQLEQELSTSPKRIATREQWKNVVLSMLNLMMECIICEMNKAYQSQ